MSTRLSAPKDGIVASARPKGWAAESWMAIFDELGPTHHAQLARGRTLARSGRVRDLWFSPGLASAEVVTNRNTHRVTIRVRVFEDEEWGRVVSRMLLHLVDIAAMLEGDLPEELIRDLGERDLPLLPTLGELDGVCDCGDFHMPCGHMAAVHNVISEALDGDPFLLLTLRGLNRDQLLARLRRAWGDPRPLHTAREESGAAPPEDEDWWISPTPLPPLKLRVEAHEEARPGVYALGPPPGRAELGTTLEPLYAAGSSAALELAFGDPVEYPGVRATSRWSGFQTGVQGKVKRRSATHKPRPAEPPAEPAPIKPADDPTQPLTERLVDLLAELESAKSKTLSERLDAPMLQIRQELLELEKLGIVYRTGQTRGTTWWLG